MPDLAAFPTRPIDLTRAAAGDDVLLARVVGDSQSRFVVNADGKLEWGPGNAPLNINLYGDVGLGGVRTDDSFAAALNVAAFLGAASETRLGNYGPGGESAISFGAAGDATIYRPAADHIRTEDTLSGPGSNWELAPQGVLRLTGGAGTSFIELAEQTADPSAPAANRVRWFTRDSGAGKTQICARFNTGAVQVIATEP